MVRLAAWFATLALSTVVAYRPGDEVCIITRDNTCSLDKLILSQTDGSTLVYPGGKTRCAFDDYSSNMTEYTTNATFFFQVFPQNTSTKLLLYFQGGGACVDDQTCNFATQCSLPIQTFQPNARALSNGILNGSDPLNLFHDWNIVHIPYCTGDLHVGKNVTTTQDQETLFSRDVCSGKKMAMHMNGYENTMSALNWAVANYPHPEQLVVSGSSAGALAAQLMSDTVATLWKVKETKAKYAVLADSYVGVTPDGKTGTVFNYYGSCDLLSGFPIELVSKCKDGTATVVEMMQNLLQHTLFSDWLHIDSKADKIQRYFETLLKVGIDQALSTNVTTPTTFFDQMMVIITGEQQVSTRVSTFFVEGEQHVFMNQDDWYNALRADTNETLGTFVKSWLGQNVGGEGTNVEKGKVAKLPAPAVSAANGVVGATVASVVVSLLAVWVL